MAVQSNETLAKGPVSSPDPAELISDSGLQRFFSSCIGRQNAPVFKHSTGTIPNAVVNMTGKVSAGSQSP